MASKEAERNISKLFMQNKIKHILRFYQERIVT